MTDQISKIKSLDYSQGKNWMVRHDNGHHGVDVFYLYPTAADPKCINPVSDVDLKMKGNSYGNYERGPSCFDGIANIFAPYYRQIPFMQIAKLDGADALIEAVSKNETYADACAALDYFFDHYNNGKPYILASHSQGSCVMQNILSKYMTQHPERYERMICAYTIGMRYTAQYLEANPHVKVAKGETDTGVVITWNTEGPGATKFNLPAADDSRSCINPLNWKTDDTYAGIEENKGSYDINTHEIIEGVADAQINLDRMVVVSTTLEEHGYQPVPCLPQLDLFGEASFHFDDWNLFHQNIKENAEKRIQSYFNNNN